MNDYPIPVQGKALIRKEEATNKTESGIYLQKQSRAKSDTAIVVSIVDGERVRNGDRILFKPTVSQTINFNDENLTIILVGDILGQIV